MSLPTQEIHLGSSLDEATLDSLADFICGDDTQLFPVYRSTTYLTRFFSGLKYQCVLEDRA